LETAIATLAVWDVLACEIALIVWLPEELGAV
jgi:hypothetical protein